MSRLFWLSAVDYDCRETVTTISPGCGSETRHFSYIFMVTYDRRGVCSSSLAVSARVYEATPAVRAGVLLMHTVFKNRGVFLRTDARAVKTPGRSKEMIAELSTTF